MNASATRSTLRAGTLLATCATLAVALSSGVHRLTRERIAAEQVHARRAALNVVLPAALYDNDPLADRLTLRAPAWLGSDEALDVWRARRAGVATALVLEAVAPDGYTGPIRLRIGVRADGTLSGVRVTAHTETPGLGDWIEAAKSDWIDRFAGRALGNPPRERWAVQRDGGAFDQFAGATVTPRAIVRAVRRALDYLDRHGAEIYAAAPDSTLEHHDAPEN